MKKIYAMIFVAAATLAGCQNVNDGLESDNQNKVEMKVGASVPTVSRTALTENAGVYKATWKAGDALNLVEVAGESVATYESAALAGDTESANFSFEPRPRATPTLQFTPKVQLAMPPQISLL